MVDTCSILDVGEIAEAVELQLGSSDSMMFVRNTMYLEGHYWFRYRGLFVHVEPLGTSKYTLHTFGVSRDSLKDKIRFFVNIGKYLFDNTNCKDLIIFVPEENLPLRLLISKLSPNPTAYLEGSKEYVYVFNRGYLGCHKQYLS